MKTEINKPWYSKINYTALAVQIIGVFAILNLIPADIEEQLTEAALLIGPALIQIFRTFFTDNVVKPEEPDVK